MCMYILRALMQRYEQTKENKQTQENWEGHFFEKSYPVFLAWPNPNHVSSTYQLLTMFQFTNF